MSTLFVNNLNTASGTTITVPTGKKVVVTDQGGITAPGGVVNTFSSSISGGASNSSTSFVKFITAGTYTTTVANSKILVMVDIATQVGNPGSASHLGVYELRHSVDSYGSSLIRFVHANYRDVSGQNGWQQTTPTFSALHAPNQSAGTSIEYQIWGRCPTGGGSIYVNDAWGHASGGTFLVQEIAP